MLFATIPSLVSTHSTPSHGGVSSRARWRKFNRPALISSAAPISKNQVLVVSTDPFTFTSSKPPIVYRLADPALLGKECSEWPFKPIGSSSNQKQRRFSNSLNQQALGPKMWVSKPERDLSIFSEFPRIWKIHV